jgi:hypothetical protein
LSKAILYHSQKDKITYKDGKVYYPPKGLCSETDREVNDCMCTIWVFDENNFFDFLGDPSKWKKDQIVSVDVEEQHSHFEHNLKRKIPDIIEFGSPSKVPEGSNVAVCLKKLKNKILIFFNIFTFYKGL